MLAALYSEVNVLCILILLLIYFKVRSGAYMQSEHRYFRLVLLSNCFFFALDVLWVFVDSRGLSIGITANWILNTLYYITSGFVSFTWFLYSESIQHSSLVENRRRLRLSALPMLLLAALSLVSVKTGWLFYIDGDNSYHRGPLYLVQLLFSYGYVIFTAVKALILSHRMVSYFKKVEYRTLAMFVVPPIIAGFVQVLLPGVSLLCVGTTLGILYVFTSMQERLISVDSLTGLNNRNRLMRHLADRMAHRDGETRLFLIMMDLDHFKSINDKYGHVEGDSALQKTAGVLKACCKNQHYFIARYGGDEFAAVCELDKGRNIEDFCRSIQEAVEAENKSCPYTLSLSLGCAEYSPEIKADLDFIKLADAELYKAKQARQAS